MEMHHKWHGAPYSSASVVCIDPSIKLWASASRNGNDDELSIGKLGSKFYDGKDITYANGAGCSNAPMHSNVYDHGRDRDLQSLANVTNNNNNNTPKDFSYKYGGRASTTYGDACPEQGGYGPHRPFGQRNCNGSPSERWHEPDPHCPEPYRFIGSADPSASAKPHNGLLAWEGRELTIHPRVPAQDAGSRYRLPDRATCPEPRVELNVDVPFVRAYRYLPQFDPTILYPLEKFSVSLAPTGAGDGGVDLVIPMPLVDRIMLKEVVQPYANSVLVERDQLLGMSQNKRTRDEWLSNLTRLAANAGARIMLVDYSPTVEVLAQELYRILLPRATENSVRIRSVGVTASEGYTGVFSCQ